LQQERAVSCPRSPVTAEMMTPRHSRAGGNPARITCVLDPRLRGDDKKHPSSRPSFRPVPAAEGGGSGTKQTSAQKKPPERTRPRGAKDTVHFSGSDWTTGTDTPCAMDKDSVAAQGCRRSVPQASLPAETLRGPQHRQGGVPDADPSTWKNPCSLSPPNWLGRRFVPFRRRQNMEFAALRQGRFFRPSRVFPAAG